MYVCTVCTVCVCVLGSRSVDQKMVERFMVATDCWDFLQSNVTYQQGVALYILRHSLKYINYECSLRNGSVDVCIFTGTRFKNLVSNYPCVTRYQVQ